MPRGGVSFRGLTGLAANFRAIEPRVADGMRELNDRTSSEIVDLARQIVPQDKGTLHDSIEREVSEQGRTFIVFCNPEVFHAAGEPVHDLYVEEGTSISPAQPFMAPAVEAIMPHHKADARALLRRAARGK